MIPSFRKKCTVTDEQVEATAALKVAREERREAARISKSLRTLRERNHFAESIELIYHGGSQ